jgi:hypothetical protein
MEVRRGACRAHVETPARPSGHGVLILQEDAGDAWRRIFPSFDQHLG